ncbi:MAG: arylsulfatase [Flavobacteriaceae bacterium]
MNTTYTFNNKFILAILAVLNLMSFTALAQSNKQPNILVIMGDDVGAPNLSAYGRGMMGYQTPNIDRIANEGMMFTDYYGEQSCTAGRAAFITGQSVIRTGLTKVGMPGAKVGIQDEDPTLGTLLKPLGYATGQFGKNHFGDRDEYLPTRHGFDEFYGNLYHLNAEEEPEDEYYPKDPQELARIAKPRGVIQATADGKVKDTGPLTKKRMETVDDEFEAAAMNFIDQNTKEGKPWLTWMNTTRMHFWTHVRPENRGRSGLNEYADGMLELDDLVGRFLTKLEDLGILENTIVIFTTDNGVHQATWPDAGVTWFRNEKTTNWEGGFRVPAMARFPKRYGIKPGTIINGVTSHMDWVPTLVAAAGNPNVTQELLDGSFESQGKNYRVHLDGYNMLDYWSGKTKVNPRRYFIYSTDGGEISAVRFADRWKAMYMVQDAEGSEVWLRKLEHLKAPYIFDLRMDPFEKALETNSYYDWYSKKVGYMINWSASYIQEFKATFKDYPQRQKPASWNITEVH